MGERATSRPPAPAAFPQVNVPGVGAVSVATLEELRDARRTDQAGADHMARQARGIEEQAEDRLADVGALLVPRRAWWQVPAALSPRLARAERLAGRISAMDERTALLEQAARARPVRAGLVLRLRRSSRGHLARMGRARAAARLRRTLVAIARAGGAAGVDVPDVEQALEQAAELQVRAEGLRTALAAVSSRVSALDLEIRLRERAGRRIGFDALYLAAYFLVHGLPAIQSGLELETGEIAHYAADATLARAPVGAGYSRSGRRSSVPVTVTGVRHWVGAFRERTAPIRALRRTDTGTLVVSSLRLSFVGRREAVGIPLESVVDMDVYTDGIAVFHRSSENPHFFLVPAPRQVAFYLNWAMSTVRSVSAGPGTAPPAGRSGG